MCLDVFLLGLILYETLCFLYLSGYFLFHVREVFNYNLFKYFLRFFLFLFFWNPYDSNVALIFPIHLWVYPQFFSFFFSLFYSSAVISISLFSSSLIHSSASIILLMIPSRVFLISVIVLFITVYFLVLLAPY